MFASFGIGVIVMFYPMAILNKVHNIAAMLQEYCFWLLLAVSFLPKDIDLHAFYFIAWLPLLLVVSLVTILWAKKLTCYQMRLYRS